MHSSLFEENKEILANPREMKAIESAAQVDDPFTRLASRVKFRCHD